MSFRLVVLNESPGVRPVGIGETLRRALDKLVMREAGDQAKTACGNLQLCAGLEAGIEGATHAMGQSILERTRARQIEEEADGSDVEEYTEGVAAMMGNLRIETVGTEEEAAEVLEAALGI